MSGSEWVEEVDALTITCVRGLDVRTIGELMGVDWSTERQVDVDGAWDAVDARDDDADVYPLQVDELDGWTVLIEPNGWLTADSQTFPRLSAGGEAVSVYWNVNARMQFQLARDGQTVRSFDPLFPDEEPAGDPLPEEAGLSFGDVEGSLQEASLELLQRVTGVRITADWLLQRPRRTWDAPAPPPHPLPVEPARPRRRWFRR